MLAQGDILFDSVSLMVSGPMGNARVTPYMGRLLEALMTSRSEILSHERILSIFYATPDEEPESPVNVVHSTMSKLRRALKTAGCACKIRVVTSVGYVLEGQRMQVRVMTDEQARQWDALQHA
jgi:DNA-binding response OmpR family regulator